MKLNRLIRLATVVVLTGPTATAVAQPIPSATAGGEEAPPTASPTAPPTPPAYDPAPSPPPPPPQEGPLTGQASGAERDPIASWVEPVLPPAPAPPPSVEVGSSSVSTLEIHGFLSQGAVITTGNDYIAPDSTHGSFQLSEVGLSVTKSINDKLRFGIQAFAQNLGQGGNFHFNADWFYLDYRWRDWLGLRVGRLKIPFGLYNEVNDIDSARAPILLPQAVYPLQGRNFLFAQTGMELYGFARSLWAGALEYRLYLGTIFIDPAILTSPGVDVGLQLNVRYVLGGRVFWETPLEGLRFGGSLLLVHLDVMAFAGGMAYPIQDRSRLAVGSAEYAHGAILLQAEYSRWHADQESVLPSSNFAITSERAYALVSYRIATWLQPATYYSLLFPNVTNREGLVARQHDLAATLRFDLNPNWILKAEAHYMVGAAALINPLSITPAPMNPAEHWGVFLLKMTGYF